MSREMKHSGIEWIGEIPKEWEVCRFKFVSKMYTGNSLNEQQKEKYSNSDFHETLPYIATKDVERDIERIDYDGGIRIPSSSDNFVIAPRNSVLLCIEGGSAGKKVGYTNQDVFFVNKLCCFTTDKNSRFLYYFILSHSFSEPFSQNLQGLIGGVSVSALKNFVISIPPLPEQQKIADYLDKVCGEVDELVSLQEQMIEELKAYKQSVITEAVTKGLNPNAPMKDSGVDWIGEMPEGWKVCRIKNVITLLTDYDANGSFADIANNVKVNVGIPYAWMVRATDLENKRYGIVDGNNYCDESTFNYLKKSYLNGGEILIAKRGEIGKVYIVPKCECKMTLAPNTYLLRLKDNFIHNRFLFYSMTSEKGKIQLLLNNKSTAIGAIYKDDVKKIFLFLPPLSEQQSIASYLDTKCSEIDSLIALKQQKIEELKDYKKSVIYEYVTGKKEVV